MRKSKSKSKLKKRQIGHGDSEQPPAKKLRGRAASISIAVGRNVSIPTDVVIDIMSFLPPRDLLHTAFASKALRNAVTTTMVLKSAIMTGSPSVQKTMGDIRQLMSSRAIQAPSPLRLLRLACGTRCEICCVTAMKSTSKGLGMFVCWKCVNQGHFRHWNSQWPHHQASMHKFDALFDHPRVAFHQPRSVMYMPSKPMRDASGESIGPIVTFFDVKKMVAHSHGFSAYIANYLYAPTPSVYDDFKSAIIEVDTIKRERASREAMQRRIPSVSVPKYKMIKKMLHKLAKLIDEPFREAALTRKFTTDAGTPNTMYPMIQMHVSFVDVLLRPYIIEPSSMKKKIRKKIATKINEIFRVILEKDFISLSFLSTDDLFERRLKDYFRDKFGNMKDLIEFGEKQDQVDVYSRVDSDFILHVREDNFVAALLELNGDFHTPLLMPDIRALSASLPSYSQLSRKNYQNSFSRYVWSTEMLKICSPDRSWEEMFRYAFTSSRKLIQLVWPALREYEDWLDEQSSIEDKAMFLYDDKRTFILQQAYRNENNLSLLARRDFVSLYKHQCDYKHEIQYW
mmetsp:Transcript_23451/g.46757  ORF Transcript_23451/g.46757 Transcript_23451/m.46757 type:complete len:568 (+) Transcript_23451:122-1825(+)